MGRLSEQIVYRNVEDLREHPRNRDLFGEPSGKSREILEISLKGKGVASPVIILEDGTIVAGHRRFRAAKRIGLKRIPCRIFYPDYPGEELELLIEDNLSQRQLPPENAHRVISTYEDLKVCRELEKRLAPEFLKLSQKLPLSVLKSLSLLPVEKQKEIFSILENEVSGSERKKLQKLQKVLSEREEELNRAHRRIEELNSALQKLKEEKEALLYEKKRHDFSLASLREEKLRLETTLSSLQEKLEKAIREKDPAEERIRKEIEEYKRRLLEKEEELSRIQAELNRKEGSIRELQEKLSRLEREKEESIRKISAEIEEKLKERILQRKFPREFEKMEIFFLLHKIGELDASFERIVSNITREQAVYLQKMFSFAMESLKNCSEKLKRLGGKHAQ